MLTRLQIRNFKRFNSIDIELGNTVVLIGPNNSGKTTALQAIALWHTGLKNWNEKRQGKVSPENRSGVTINRNDLISIPTPEANLLWRDLHVRKLKTVGGSQQTEHVNIEIIVDGVTSGNHWSCGLEFDYANDESLYCRPLRKVPDGSKRMPIPHVESDTQIAFLPPMSGLAAIEPRLEIGRINVLIGEGQTAQVLRNLCLQIFEVSKSDWDALQNHITKLFGITLFPPVYSGGRGEITMSYKEKSGVTLDLSSSGRGLQQTLLLLAYLYSNPSTILLLDEPDAHLEVLRQRQIYQLLTDVAAKKKSQLIAASHSEIVLNEAADRDVVIAFVGKPHRIDDRGSQLLKSLNQIGFDQYYQAEQTGWVLYLEGSTDLAILQSFARMLNHRAAKYLVDDALFVSYVGNQPQKARDHFNALRFAKPDLLGIALFDRLERELQSNTLLQEMMWRRREIENYLCSEEVLIGYAQKGAVDDLFGLAEIQRREKAMRKAIEEIQSALKTLGKPDPWSADIKASDEFLDRVFVKYFEDLGIPNEMQKSNYHRLADFISVEKIDLEIVEKLDAIVAVAEKSFASTIEADN